MINILGGINMKKIILLLLVAAMVLSGCGIKEEKETSKHLNQKLKKECNVEIAKLNLEKKGEMFISLVQCEDSLSAFSYAMDDGGMFVKQRTLQKDHQWIEKKLSLCDELKKSFEGEYGFGMYSFTTTGEGPIYAFYQKWMRTKDPKKPTKILAVGIVKIEEDHVDILWEKKMTGENKKLLDVKYLYERDNGDLLLYSIKGKLLEYNVVGDLINDIDLKKIPGQAIGFANDEIWTYDDEKNFFASYNLDNKKKLQSAPYEIGRSDGSTQTPMVYSYDKDVNYIMLPEKLLLMKDKQIEEIKTNIKLPKQFMAPNVYKIGDYLYFAGINDSSASDLDVYIVKL